MPVQPHPATAYLWSAFSRLRARCAAGYMGLNPLSWVEIDAYCRRVLDLDPWEVEIIERLDDLWMMLVHRKQEEAAPTDASKPAASKQPNVSVRPMSANLFDAIML